MNNGENQREVADRMYNALIKVLNNYKGKKGSNCITRNSYNIFIYEIRFI